MLAARLNRAEALKFLGFLNLLLSSATTEAHLTARTEPLHEVQTHVFRQVVGAKLLEDLKATFRSAHLLDRPILHRSELLFAIRLVATHGGNTLIGRNDFDMVGDLLFLINGLFRVDPATSKAAKALWLATQMGPLYETETPPTIELSWPRMEELFTQRLPAVVNNREEIQRLQQVAVFSLLRYSSLAGLIAHSKTMLGSVTREVQGHSGLARLDPETGVYFRLRVSDFLLG